MHTKLLCFICFATDRSDIKTYQTTMFYMQNTLMLLLIVISFSTLKQIFITASSLHPR